MDDNATNRVILEETLAGWKMRPAVADSAKKALALLEQAEAGGAPFTLALVDVHMPNVDGYTLVEWVRARPELAGLRVLVLTSGGRPGDLARCRHLGIAAYLTKPVTPADLFEGIAALLHADLVNDERGAAAATSPRRRPLHILLAEDNPVNQTVVVRRLEQRGHSVTVADNGWRRSRPGSGTRVRFGPDGCADAGDGAASRRRRVSATARTERVGICQSLRMTAHAMKGDRERCLESGMDAYLGKPIRVDELFQAIDDLIYPVLR